MAVLRFLSALFFLIAVTALAADATLLLAGDLTFRPASLQQRWSEIAPAVLNSVQMSLANQQLSWVWTMVISPLLSLPAVFLFAALGLLFGYAGRHRRRINVFVNQ